MDECGFDFRDLLLNGYSEKGERFHTEKKLGRENQLARVNVDRWVFRRRIFPRR